MNRARRWWAGTGCLTRCGEGHTYRPGCLLCERRRLLEALVEVYRWIARAVARWLVRHLTRYLADPEPVRADRVPVSRLAAMGGVHVNVVIPPASLLSPEEAAARHLAHGRWAAEAWEARRT